MIRAVIVEDEKPARDRLRRLLSEHSDIALEGEAADAAEAVALIDRVRPDLCFLDVEMPEGDGFEVLRRISHRPRIIFTTAYDRYAVPAFEVNSLDYLLKPFSRERFAAALDRARAALGAGVVPSPAEILRLLEEIRAGIAPAAGPPGAGPGGQPGTATAVVAPSGPAPGGPSPGAAAASGGQHADPAAGAPLRIPVRRANKIVLLDPADIVWFEAEETVVFARTTDARLLVERTLNELEEQLGHGFFRTHRSCLVNVAHIAEILPGEGGSGRIVMKDAARTVLPLSRRQARQLRAIIPW